MSFCQTPMNFGRGTPQWPRGMPVKWTVRDAVRPFSKSDTKEIAKMAFAMWEAVCGIRFVHTGSTANITIQSARLDGKGGVLARAQLPVGNVGPHTQLWAQFDSYEDWVVKANMGREMDLLRVMAHEFGHSMGLGHAPQGSRNLMAPTVSSIRTPQKWGITESVKRYGEVHETPSTDGKEVVVGRLIKIGDNQYFESDGKRIPVAA